MFEISIDISVAIFPKIQRASGLFGMVRKDISLWKQIVVWIRSIKAPSKPYVANQVHLSSVTYPQKEFYKEEYGRN